jgi:Domain of unknown function (DUF4262)
MINGYCRDVRPGTTYQRGVRYPGYLEGFEVYFEPARRGLLNEYTLGCDRYYGGADYSVVQIIWPSTAGVWPWYRSTPQSLRARQPMLGRAQPNRR